MKKIFFFQLLAAAAFMTSCSSSDDVVADNGNVANNAEEELVPIHLGISGTNASAVTKGTGTVGSTDNATNAWEGQRINVLAFFKPSSGGTTRTMKFATDDADNQIYNFTNGLFITPGGPETAAPDGTIFNKYYNDNTTGIKEARPFDDLIRYYPKGTTEANKYMDFVGYRVDDATTWDGTAAASPEFDNANPADATKCTMQIKIDGTQDIMTATSSPVKATSMTSIAEYNVTTDADGVANYLYSARAARKGIHPNLNFKHQLSRMTFKVAPSTTEAADPNTGIEITQIEITSYDKGTLTLATTDMTEEPSITWKTDVPRATFTLLNRSGSVRDNLSGTAVKDLKGKAVYDPDNANFWDGNTYSIGEAVMVAPDTKYLVTVHMKQKKQKQWSVDIDADKPDTYIEVPGVVETKVVLDAQETAFEKGKSYIVKVIVAGINEVRVFTTLDKWNESDVISTLDPENDDSVLPGETEKW